MLRLRRWRALGGIVGVSTALAVTSCAGIGRADDPANIVLTDLGNPAAVSDWTPVNDPVMGGRSASQIGFGDGGLRFSGTISLENNGGFASAQGPEDPEIGRKATGAQALSVRAVGDGKTYLLKVEVAGQPWSYTQRFDTDAAVPQNYPLPIENFEPVGMRLDPAPDAPQTLDPSRIDQVGIYILDKQQGPFTITVSGIDAVR